jgi:branched-chain amino acid transport system substrate-binding protein
MKVSHAVQLAAGLLCCAVSYARAADSRDIDVVISLTGPGAFLGVAEQQALQLQEKQVNAAGGVHGKPVRFVFHDDQSSPQIAVQLASQVKQSNPAVVFGSTLVAACNAIAPLLRGGPMQYCFSAGVHPAAGANMFTAGVSTTDAAQALLTFFRGKGWTRVALLTSTDATGQDADKSFDALLAMPQNKGMQLVQRLHFNTSDVSITAQIERIRQDNPQAIIGWTTGSSFTTVLRELINAGIDLPIGTTPGNMTLAQIKQMSSFAPKQLYSGAPLWPLGDDPKYVVSAAVSAKQKALYDAYAEIGTKPDEGAILGWDPGIIVLDALQKLPETVTGEQLRAYLAKVNDAPGASGIYDFVETPQRGLDMKNVLVTRWDVPAEKWLVVSQAGGAPLP